MKKGLIRYASENAITQKVKLTFTRRIKAYSAVLSVLIILVSALLILRSEVSFVLLRSQGSLYTVIDENKVSNLYNFKITNKTNRNMDLNARLLEQDGEIKIIGNDILLKGANETEGVIMVIMDRKNIKSIKTEIKIGLYEGNKLIKTAYTTFIGPGKMKKRSHTK